MVQRAPLGPFPQPETYDHELPFTPPTGRDLYFYRGNFCGIRLEGAPVVPGCNADHPDVVMACLLDNYPEAWQEQYLTTYASYGYTHLQRSIGHSLYYGHSLQDHMVLSKKAQNVGLYCDEWVLNGGEGTDWFLKTPNQDAAYWEPILRPIVEPMLAAGVIDTACVAWQMDQMQGDAPGNPTISIIALMARLLPSAIPLYTHWVNEALAWWKTGGEVWVDPQYYPEGIEIGDRFSWWRAMGPYLTGGYHQGDNQIAITDPTLYQGKLRDTLNPFNDGRMGWSNRSGPRRFSLVGFEVTAQFQFDGQCTEHQGDTTGYLVTCTTGDDQNGGVMGGYGNGASLPDGWPL